MLVFSLCVMRKIIFEFRKKYVPETEDHSNDDIAFVLINWLTSKCSGCVRKSNNNHIAGNIREKDIEKNQEGTTQSFLSIEAKNAFRELLSNNSLSCCIFYVMVASFLFSDLWEASDFASGFRKFNVGVVLIKWSFLGPN